MAQRRVRNGRLWQPYRDHRARRGMRLPYAELSDSERTGLLASAYRLRFMHAT